LLPLAQPCVGRCRRWAVSCLSDGSPFQFPSNLPSGQEIHASMRQRRIEALGYLVAVLTRSDAGRVSHDDDDFSLGVSFFQTPDGLGGLAQRVRPVDYRRELAGLDELLEDDHVFLVWFHREASHLLAHER
jgi:hypothetical protein